jgi:hypothetical protein
MTERSLLCTCLRAAGALGSLTALLIAYAYGDQSIRLVYIIVGLTVWLGPFATAALVEDVSAIRAAAKYLADDVSAIRTKQ